MDSSFYKVKRHSQATWVFRLETYRFDDSTVETHPKVGMDFDAVGKRAYRVHTDSKETIIIVDPDGRLQNKKTGLVMNLPNLETFSIVDQQNVQDSTVQKFEYYDYTISVEHKDGLVLGVVGEKAPTAPIALIKRDDDSDLQQWEIVV
ncbi:hypothetical protein BGX21_003000 [Mortierella sp. AD011]|nr:hypothetical protein BGX21_003000 [Mortierella sp. AD011]